MTAECLAVPPEPPEWLRPAGEPRKCRSGTWAAFARTSRRRRPEKPAPVEARSERLMRRPFRSIGQDRDAEAAVDALCRRWRRNPRPGRRKSPPAGSRARANQGKLGEAAQVVRSLAQRLINWTPPDHYLHAVVHLEQGDPESRLAAHCSERSTSTPASCWRISHWAISRFAWPTNVGAKR